MKTIKDLGRAKKIQSPGKYDDISDEDLGRALKIKYPGEYDDFVDTAITMRGSQSLGRRNNTQNLEERGMELWQKTDGEMGKFVAWWRGRKIDAKNQVIVKAITQFKLLAEQADLQANRVIKEIEREAELRLFLQRHHYEIEQLKIFTRLAQKAEAQGMTLETAQEAILAEMQTELKIKEMTAKNNLEIERENLQFERKEKEAEAEQRRKIELRDKEFQTEVDLANEKLRLAIIVDHLTKQQVVTLLQDLIDQQYIKIAEMKEDPKIPASAKAEIEQSRLRIIQMFMEQQNETQRKALGG